jgi:hypothetical protein
MTNPTWPIGPARTRGGREAKIYEVYRDYIHGAMLCDDGEWIQMTWYLNGSTTRFIEKDTDLLPPKLTRDEAIAECYVVAYGVSGSSSAERIADAITHWEKLKAEGRIDE